MFSERYLGWSVFALIILVSVTLDLVVAGRRGRSLDPPTALKWVTLWVFLSMSFATGVYLWRGPEPAFQFLTGYLVEASLSLDNLFIFLLIFTYFRVPEAYQHRVLFWGITGALVMRGVFISLGVLLFNTLHWVIYVFGVFLVWAGIQIGRGKHGGKAPSESALIGIVRSRLRIADDYSGERFFVRRGGRLAATPLFLALLAVESSDLFFALDSIPAIFGITRDPFIIYTSNAFAILGMRSFYFLIAGLVRSMRFLKLGLAVILVFVGVKMLLSGVLEVPATLSLAVIVGVLAVTALASRISPGPVIR